MAKLVLLMLALLAHVFPGESQEGIVCGAYASVEQDPAEVAPVPCGSRQHPGVYAETAAFEDFLAPFLE